MTALEEAIAVCKRMINSDRSFSGEWRDTFDIIFTAAQSTPAKVTDNTGGEGEYMPELEIEEVTVDEFIRMVFGDIKDMNIPYQEIHGAILNARDAFPNGVKIVAGG